MYKDQTPCLFYLSRLFFVQITNCLCRFLDPSLQVHLLAELQCASSLKIQMMLSSKRAPFAITQLIAQAQLTSYVTYSAVSSYRGFGKSSKFPMSVMAESHFLGCYLDAYDYAFFPSIIHYTQQPVCSAQISCDLKMSLTQPQANPQALCSCPAGKP